MFRCEQCNKVVGPHVAQKRKVVARRDTTYRKRRRDEHDTDISYGWEIVKELSLCKECHERRID